jgi:uncharacterized protein with FMN-binding domain
MSKKLLVSLFVILILGIGFAACSNGSTEEDTRHPPYGTAPDYFTGMVTGSASGHSIENHPASVDISLTLVRGYITAAVVTGEGHTPSVGGIVMKKAETEIVEKNEVAVEVITGASATPLLINAAGVEALAKTSTGQ